jgi:hypothetical protein
MTRTTVTASVLMFGGPFLLVAACYAALPVEVPVLLNPTTGAMFLAPKSLFTVFRVPLEMAMVQSKEAERTNKEQDACRCFSGRSGS